MNINGIKTILYKCTFFIVFVFCLFSCNNSNKNSKAKIDSDKIQETINTQETAGNLNIVSESRKAVINSDCEYYHYGNPVGNLKQGQSILILERYEPFGFDVVVEVAVVDSGKKGFVKEKYITYDDELYTAWFKNILLTREYYYTESAEFINANSGGYALNDNGPYNRKDILQLWRRLYSEERLRISENYFVIGDAEAAVDYRLESVKKDSNKYTLLLSNYDKEEYEVTLIDNGNSIVITQCVVKSKNQEQNFISYSLNYNYVPCDEEKSRNTESRVIVWIDEEIKKLENGNK